MDIFFPCTLACVYLLFPFFIYSRYLVSVGDNNDKGLFVWDWREQTKLTMNKLSKNTYSACFSNDGSKLATVGEKNIKIWQFSEQGDIIRKQAKEKPDAYIIEGKHCSTNFM